MLRPSFEQLLRHSWKPCVKGQCICSATVGFRFRAAANPTKWVCPTFYPWCFLPVCVAHDANRDPRPPAATLTPPSEAA